MNSYDHTHSDTRFWDQVTTDFPAVGQVSAWFHEHQQLGVYVFASWDDYDEEPLF
jgi:hypothetical protein